MSYSFSVRAANKAALGAAISDELNKVVAQQAVHKTDAAQALHAATSLLDLTFDDPARDLAASVSGSIWVADAGVEQISLSINISHTTRA